MSSVCRLTFVFWIGLILPACARAANTPQVYPLGADDRASGIFALQANGADVPVLDHTPLYDYAHFSADGPVTISITVPEAVRTWHISPRSQQISATVTGRRLTFLIPRATYLIVKVNELKELALAVDPTEGDAPPSAGQDIHNVVAPPYSAAADGRTPTTASVQRAIDDAHAAGGGVVYFPPGTYRSASLVLRSNVSLYLAGGAVLRSSGDPADFRDYYRKDSLKMHGTWFLHTEPGSHDIRIFGRGTIDGNARELRGKNHYLNNLVVPLQTSRFTIEGVVLRDSGLWGLIPTRSDHVTIRNTKHFNEVDQFFENDAMDIIECQDVRVVRTFAISEDDTYSTKTWREDTDIATHWPGKAEPLENVIFEGALAWSRCATFKVGFGCFQPQRNITFRNVTSYRSMRAVAVNRLWGAVPAENIVFENVAVEGFQPRERDRDKCRWLDISTGVGAGVVNTVLRNITVEEVGLQPSRIEGHDSSAMIDGLRFENVAVRGKQAATLSDLRVGVTNAHVQGVHFVPAAKEPAR